MKVGINIQSYVDVITNSSTTVFCSIESDFETIIQNIEDYLNSFLPFKIKYHRSCIIKTYSITFEVEYGENEELTENLNNMKCGKCGLYKNLDGRYAAQWNFLENGE